MTRARRSSWIALLLLLASAHSVQSAELRIEPSRVRLSAGETQQLLVAQVGDRDADLTVEAKYSSTNAEVVTVSDRGVLRAHRKGNATIEVRARGLIRRIPVETESASEGGAIRFVTEVVPILTKLGCNSGGCHGKATGQNGFALSLLGFEPELDYEAITKESRGRRLFPSAAERSLLLMKATGTTPHGGGRLLRIDSDDYRILRDWIALGAPAAREDDPLLQRIELSPGQRVLTGKSFQQLLVTAHFSNGTSRDVTRQAVYQSNEPEIASVDRDGLVRTNLQKGLVTVMARFGDKIATFHAAIPYAGDAARTEAVNRRLDQLKQSLSDTPIDRLLLKQWKRLAVVPSSPADDATFLRRAMIDICGTLPTRDQIEKYLADKRIDKRARLIDRLLERPEYASYFALKWADILQNRGASYSTSRQRPGTTLFASWIRDSLAFNKPYDRFVTEIITASGSQKENPPTNWYRTVRKPVEYVESVAQAFLGVRIQCAQCHHHPAERWSQSDYYSLAAVFARVGRKGGFADAEVPTDEIIFLKDRGEVRHPRTREWMQPRGLGGVAFQLGRYEDPRRSFARWMTSAENPYFARTMVNRMWAHFLGRGFIHPLDDSRSTNPPSNPELLDALAKDFIVSGYDVKQLLRVICNSYAYGLQSAPNEWNAGDTQTFARFYARRLTAETLLDGMSQVLEVPTEFAGGPGKLPSGTRAIELPDENVASAFLDVFGRSARMTACECERVDAPALTQALELVNSVEIHRKLTAKTGFARRMALSDQPHSKQVTEIFLRVLGRFPRPEENRVAIAFLKAEPDRIEAYRSLLWSLLATNEFLFNH